MHKNRVRGYNKRFYPGVALIVAAMLCLVFALTRLNVPFLGAMSHILVYPRHSNSKKQKRRPLPVVAARLVPSPLRYSGPVIRF